MKTSDGIPLLDRSPQPDLTPYTDIVEGLDPTKLDTRECHATGKSILEALGGPAEGRRAGWHGFKTRLQSDTGGVYKVDVQIPADESLSPRWDHTFAVLKVGSRVVIYQSFESGYSLRGWLERIAGPTRFAAAKGEALAPEQAQAFFQGVEGMLAKFAAAKAPPRWLSCFYNTPDYDQVANTFYNAAIDLFGAPPGQRQATRYRIGLWMPRGSIEVRWTRAPLKPQ